MNAKYYYQSILFAHIVLSKALPRVNKYPFLYHFGVFTLSEGAALVLHLRVTTRLSGTVWETNAPLGMANGGPGETLGNLVFHAI